jgi:hypothetical protein
MAQNPRSFAAQGMLGAPIQRATPVGPRNLVARPKVPSWGRSLDLGTPHCKRQPKITKCLRTACGSRRTGTKTSWVGDNGRLPKEYRRNHHGV